MLCTLSCRDGPQRARSKAQTSQLPAPPSPKKASLSRSNSPSRKETRLRTASGTAAPEGLSKDDILNWLLVCPEEDASFVFARCSLTRGHVMKMCQVALQEKEVTDWLFEVKQDCCERIMKSLLSKRSSFAGSDLMRASRAPLTEEDVTDWLLDVKHDCLARVLQTIAEERPTTLEDALASSLGDVKQAARVSLALKTPVAPPAPDGQVSIDVDEDTDLITSQKTDMSTTIVSLASLNYFSTEGEPYCEVDVMRVGNLEKTSKVCYQTNPGSAKPGKTYQHTAGTLEFKPGEALKYFNVPLIDDDEWNTTLEFEVQLLREHLVNCQLDMYLTSATVKVIDNDAFPTNKYREPILARDWKSIPGPGLLMEYFKLNKGNATVRKGTTKMVAVDQLSNLYFLLKLFMNIYLVDYVLSPEKEDDELVIIQNKEMSLVMLLIVTIVPFAILYVLDQRKFSWKVAGTSRAIVQKSLLRKFLNYDEESRQSIDKGDLVMAMTRDAFKCVHDGYMNFLELIKEVGKIILVLVYQFSVPYVFGRPMRLANILVPFFAFPILLVSFLKLRVRVTTMNFTTMNEAQDDFVDYVQQAVTNYRLTADYDARSTCVSAFEKLIGRFNAAFTNTSRVLGVNNYFPRWVTVCIVSLYIIVGGQQTIRGNMSLGMFLADVQLYTQLGEAWGTIYKVLLEMQTCFPAMERIVRLENLPTDVPQRARLLKWNQKVTNKLRTDMEREGRMVNVDDMAMEVNNLQISSSGKGGAINNKGGMRLQQGHLVALVGNRGQGKATLLKAISSVILPRTDVEDPGFFMPPHLRVLHVSLEPMFFKGTLMDNLTFGVKKTTNDGSPDRVRKICDRLNLGEEAMKMLDDGEVQEWGEVFSQTTKGIINLARALVANPDVMCIHKPTQVFDDSMSNNVMRCLEEFVRNKGLELSLETWSQRRPRTCIFTSSEHLNLNYADTVVHLSKSSGIRILQKEDVTPEMFS